MTSMLTGAETGVGTNVSIYKIKAKLRQLLEQVG